MKKYSKIFTLILALIMIFSLFSGFAYSPSAAMCERDFHDHSVYVDNLAFTSCSDCSGDGLVTCPNCRGLGSSGSANTAIGCSRCGGSGVSSPNENTMIKGSGTISCSTCGGDGLIYVPNSTPDKTPIPTVSPVPTVVPTVTPISRVTVIFNKLPHTVSTNDVISSTVYNLGNSVKFPSVPIRDGFKFLGWYIPYFSGSLPVDIDVSELSITEGYISQFGNVINVYAKYEGVAVPDSATVRIFKDRDLGTSGSELLNSYKLSVGEKFKFPVIPVRSGYVFKSWNYYPFNDIVLNSDTVLTQSIFNKYVSTNFYIDIFAVWEKENDVIPDVPVDTGLVEFYLMNNLKYSNDIRSFFTMQVPSDINIGEFKIRYLKTNGYVKGFYTWDILGYHKLNDYDKVTKNGKQSIYMLVDDINLILDVEAPTLDRPAEILKKQSIKVDYVVDGKLFTSISVIPSDVDITSYFIEPPFNLTKTFKGWALKADSTDVIAADWKPTANSTLFAIYSATVVEKTSNTLTIVIIVVVAILVLFFIYKFLQRKNYRR